MENRNAHGGGTWLRWSLGVIVLLMPGCMVGPDFHAPKTYVPSQWSGMPGPSAVDAASIAVQEPITMVCWWETFNDAVLTTLVQRALRSSPDLRLAGARIRQARAARGAGLASLGPTVDAGFDYRRRGSGANSSGDNIGGGSGGREQDLFQVGLDSSWELDFFGGTRRNVEALDAEVRSSVEDRRDVLVTLMADVAVNYMNLRGLQTRLAIARRNLEAQKRTAAITRKRFEAGFASGLDQASADGQAATTASEIPRLESAAREAVFNISVLLGEEPTTLAKELEVENPLPVTPPRVPVGLPSEIIRRRPDIRRAEAEVHAATARIGVAAAELFPKFSLTGSLGYSSADLASLVTPATQAWSIGPSVTWRIFDSGRIRWSIEEQKAMQEQTLVEYEKTVLTALRDVEAALQAYAREQERRRLLEEAVKSNGRAVELAMELYTSGETDFLNVLTAQRSLYVSQEALALSLQNVNTSLIALYKALGGGWEMEEPSSLTGKSSGFSIRQGMPPGLSASR